MVAHYFILRITNSITGVMQTTLFLLPNFLTDGVITNTGVADAISNYLDMDLTHGDFQHQLAVYYQDAKTGFGGHNGSKNFCVHYGYADNSGYANGPLPYIYFGDGLLV